MTANIKIIGSLSAYLCHYSKALASDSIPPP
jgi:hypothetical protein